MKDLIKRLEGLGGPDREVDAEVASFFGCDVHELGNDYVILVDAEPTPDPFRLPAYTESLDAALTLVPEGRWFSVSGPKYFAVVEHGRPPSFRSPGGPCPNPAIALTIACLKARDHD